MAQERGASAVFIFTRQGGRTLRINCNSERQEVNKPQSRPVQLDAYRVAAGGCVQRGSICHTERPARSVVRDIQRSADGPRHGRQAVGLLGEERLGRLEPRLAPVRQAVARLGGVVVQPAPHRHALTAVDLRARRDAERRSAAGDPSPADSHRTDQPTWRNQGAVDTDKL